MSIPVGIFAGILSNPEEQVTWKEAGMCRDHVNTRNALFMRTCCIGRKRQWPLILDPDNQVLHWVKLLQENDVVSFHQDEGNDSGDLPGMLEFDVLFPFYMDFPFSRKYKLNQVYSWWHFLHTTHKTCATLTCGTEKFYETQTYTIR